MSQNVQLVFFGEILPGFNPDETKSNLSRLLNIRADQVEAIFSGRRVVLKHDLPAREAPRYLNYLQKIGVQAVAEPLNPPRPSIPPAEPTIIDETPEPKPLAANEMECPKCKEHQPKRTLCRNCGTDMPRFLAAQEAIKAEVEAARVEQRQSVVRSRGDQGAGAVGHAADGPGMLGSGFSGRIGRGAYFAGSWLIGAILVWAAVAAFRMQSLVLMAVIGLVMLFVTLRLTILRCHDIGWSGWLSLVMLIPYVGAGFSILLLLIPGTRGENNHGLPSRPLGLIPVLGILVLSGASFALAFMQLGDVIPEMAASWQSPSPAEAPPQHF